MDMKVRIARGTNPTIRFSLEGLSLSAAYTRGEGKSATKDFSYATIRRDLESHETAIAEDELQITMDDTGKVSDSYGNEFRIGGDFALLKLSRDYTLNMKYDQYVLQFNLIDTSGRLFTHKPINVEVLYDIAKFSE